MIKIWCERCKGSGGLDRQSTTGIPYTQRCPRCAGLGYLKNTEIERFAEIGEATEKAFENEYSVDLFVWDDFADAVLFINVLDSVEELIEWAEGEGE